MRLTMLAEKLFKDSFVWGALLTARWAPRGVRFHPTSRIFGDADRVHIGPGAKVRGRVTLRTTGEGRIELGPRTWLADDVSIDTDRIVEVGADTTIQVRSSLNGRVAIGRGCLLAPGVFASSGTHVFRQWPELPIRIQERLAAETPELADRFDRPVVIEDDCRIGVNAVINPGVTIGKGAVIGANAVVTRDVRPYSVVAGVPAQPVSKRLDWKPPRCLDATAAEAVPYLCGVDIQVEGATVSATLDGSATIALEAATGGRIGIEVEASRTAGLIVGAERHRLTPGRNRLQIGGIAAFLSGRFGVPHLQLPVALAPDDSTPVRLLVAEWIPDRSPEPVADWRQSTP